MKKIGLALACCICCLGYAIGQGISIKLLFYHPPENESSGLVLVKTDQEQKFQKKPVLAWFNNHPFPVVAYVSGSVPRVSAQFTKPASGSPGQGCEIPDNNTLYARAEVSVNNVVQFKLPAKALSQSCEYPPTSFKNPTSGADAGFEKYLVQYIPELKIKWQYTSNPQDENSWKDAGESSNRMYLLHNTPVTGNPGNGEETTYFYSSIHLSCNSAHGKGTNGANNPDPDAVAAGIYDEFRDRCVKKFGSANCMMYWGQSAPNCHNISQFLDLEDASCGEWASFYNDMLRVHGLSSGSVVIVYQDYINNRGVLNPATKLALQSNVNVFFGNEASKVSFPMLGGQVQSSIFVKNWAFNTNELFYLDRDSDDPFQVTVPYAQGMTHSIHGAEVSGVSAQGTGNLNPPSIFTNHAIVAYHDSGGQTVYYDPSYGTPAAGSYSSPIAWESASMAGYGTVITYKKIPNQEEYEIMWVYELEDNNGSTLQTSFHE